jgi:hypothetical protein
MAILIQTKNVIMDMRQEIFLIWMDWRNKVVLRCGNIELRCLLSTF